MMFANMLHHTSLAETMLVGELVKAVGWSSARTFLRYYLTQTEQLPMPVFPTSADPSGPALDLDFLQVRHSTWLQAPTLRVSQVRNSTWLQAHTLRVSHHHFHGCRLPHYEPPITTWASHWRRAQNEFNKVAGSHIESLPSPPGLPIGEEPRIS